MAVAWDGCCSWEAMYAAFPAEREDSLAWDSKMAFWMGAIRKYCATRKTAVFKLSQLHSDFQRFGRIPKCLGTVVQDMVNRGLARRLSFYVTELDPEGSKWSIWEFVQKPISFSFNWFLKHPTNWVIRKLFSSKENQEDSNNSLNANAKDEEPYVLVELVRVFAEDINGVQKRNAGGGAASSAENLTSYRALMQLSREIVADETSFRLSLLHLSGQNRCSITPGDDGQKVVRLVESGDEFVQPSSVELKLFRLKEMAEKLELSIENISQLMAKYKESAKDSLNSGNRSEALRYLRRKKQLEPSVNSKELTLDRIIALINALEQTESHKQALDAYRSGIEIFKTMKDNCGLSVDEIDKTMLTMQEMFDDSHELEKTMSMAFNSPLISSSDDDLERELNELLDSPSPPSRLGSASTDGKAEAGLRMDGSLPTVSSPAPLPAFKRRSSPRANAARKSSLQDPAVHTDEPQDNKPVKVQIGKGRKSQSSSDSTDAPVKRRNVGKSPQHHPLGDANECVAA